MVSLLSEISSLEKHKANLLQRLRKQLESLPDNPRIKRINQQCFVIMSKDLGRCWSPEHHDFRQAYRMLAARLMRADPAKLISSLRRILADGQFVGDVSYGRRPILLHADVVANVRTISGWLMLVDDVVHCSCGAYGVSIKGVTYYMPEELFRQHFPDLTPDRSLVNCDYCVNHWGVDLCGCGSGSKLGSCENDLPECAEPAQNLELQIASPGASPGQGYAAPAWF